MASTKLPEHRRTNEEHDKPERNDHQEPIEQHCEPQSSVPANRKTGWPPRLASRHSRNRLSAPRAECRTAARECTLAAMKSRYRVLLSLGIVAMVILGLAVWAVLAFVASGSGE
jgi:hypothetical protein